MRDCSQLLTANRLLAALPHEDFTLLQPHLELVKLHRRQVLVDYDTPIRHVYFPESGVGSKIAASPDGHVVEVTMFGRDGLSGIPVLLWSTRTATKTFMQVEGEAWCIPTDTLQSLFFERPTLHHFLLRYAQVTMLQMAYTALSNSSHHIEQRLARWLLMAHDRMDGDILPLTHDFLALMLDVRRPGVTVATHMLEGERLIRATRGRIEILDRAGLEALAVASYGVPEAEYERLIGKPLRKQSAPAIGQRPPERTADLSASPAAARDGARSY